MPLLSLLSLPCGSPCFYIHFVHVNNLIRGNALICIRA